MKFRFVELFSEELGVALKHRRFLEEHGEQRAGESAQPAEPRLKGDAVSSVWNC